MSSKFEEKQVVEKDLRKDKELQAGEKGKSEKAEKESKDQKDHPDSKHAKDGKDTKDHPDAKAQKDHKDGHKEGKEHKELLPDKTHKDDNHEVFTQAFAAQQPQPPQAQAHPKLFEKPLVETKFHKEVKIEKLEFKEYKHEKFEHKEKSEKEKIEFLEVYGGGPPPGGPGPVEQRLTALETTTAQLLHFINQDSRPDLSQGALRQEPDAAPDDAAKRTDPKSPTKKP
jgi:hypothetical protein